MHYYLQQQAALKVVAHNWQIIADKRTIGELDFLYYHQQTQQYYHLEQVFKFYIYWPVGTRSPIECWIGPNNNDHLVQKLCKLQERQFPLLQAPPTQALLAQQGLPTNNIQPQLSFKAALFTPWGQPFPKDSALNPACWRGYWLTKDDFARRDWSNAHFFVPEKQDWGSAPKQQRVWCGYEQIQPIVQRWLERQKAPLCWIKTAQGEFLQLFILWW